MQPSCARVLLRPAVHAASALARRRARHAAASRRSLNTQTAAGAAGASAAGGSGSSGGGGGMALRRVVVTGLGLVTPLGVGVAHVWPRLLRGESAVRHIGDVLGLGPVPAAGEWPKGHAFTAAQLAAAAKLPYPHAAELAAVLTQLPSKVAAFVPRSAAPEAGAFHLESAVDRSVRASTSPFIHYALAAAREALTHARWGSGGGGPALSDAQRERTGVAIGSGIGSVEEAYEAGHTIHSEGVRRASPHGIPRMLINLAAGHVSMAHGLRGPLHAVSTACATGANALGDAARLIAFGDADVMVAGGSEAAVTPISLTLFSRCKALATKFNATPAVASRPFDAARDGFVMGEGAGVVVLEEREHALRRGATPIAELTGYGLSGDAHHITSPDPTGAGALRCMRQALAHAARVTGSGNGSGMVDVGYVNAHATSTPTGDGVELKALQTLFGATAARRIPVSSTKGATGHLLGAAGAVEAIFAIMALHTGCIPPTAALHAPDPDLADCNLPRAPTPTAAAPAPVPLPLQHVLTNSFGFGGVNASLVFSKP